MSERIEKADLISQEALDAVEKLKKDIELLNKEFQALLKSSQAINRQITGASGIKELNKQTVEATRLQNKLNIEQQKYELAQKKITLATEKATIAQQKHNAQLEKAKVNTNTWTNALGSFQFKFNFLGNAVASLTAGLAGLATMVAGKVLKSFVSFFTASEKGMEMLERKTAGFSAAMAVLSGQLIKLGEQMVGGQEKSIKWGTGMEILTRWFIGLGNVIPAVNRWIKETKTEMNGAAKIAEEYTGQMQILEDIERSLIVPRAEANKQLKQANLDYADSTLSIEERVAALFNAIQIENKMADAEIEHQKAIVAQIETVNAAKAKANQLLDSDLLKLENAKAKVIDLETESLGRQTWANMKFQAGKKELEKENIKSSTKNAEEILRINKEAALAEEIIIDDLIEYKEEANTVYEDRVKELRAERIAERKAEAEEEKRIEAEKEEAKKMMIQGTFDFASSLLDLKSARLDAAMQRELAAAEGNEAEQQRIKKKYAREQQKIEVKRALINGAMSLTNLLANIPGAPINPMYWVAVGLSAAITGVQVATIKAQKFAKGTKNSPEGVHWVGEKGTELMIDPAGNVGFSPSQASLAYLQKGTKIFPADVTRDLLDTMSYQSNSTRKQDKKNELVPLIQALVNKPVTSVTIDNNGITVMNRSEQTLTRRVDKYFRN